MSRRTVSYTDDGGEVDWASEGGALPDGPATDPDEDDAPAGD